MNQKNPPSLPNVSGSYELYERAKQLIPGRTMLLSKRPEIWAPDAWPVYYRRAWGCKVEDVDGNIYTDFTGDVGATLLGRADEEVNAAVCEAATQGNLCLQNCPRELELAELLTRTIPCAEMVRFCRGGGEADAIAVRIARGYTKRDLVAFCGYHGWHDWYLSANLADDSTLDGHLLPGLRPLGVPRGLSGTAMPFKYNDLQSLKSLLESRRGQFAAIIMEATRHHPPTAGFLEGVRKLADEHGVVLIFDEVVTGFRMALGGAQGYFGVTPDLATFAKTVSNGYPMGAVVGRREVMQTAEEQFISSTYWTDAIGTAAALACLKKIQRTGAIAKVWDLGRSLQAGLEQAIADSGAPAKVEGWPPLVILAFNHADEATARAMKTFYVRGMLARRYLATGSHYLTVAHTPEEIHAYLAAAKEVLGGLKGSLDRGTLMADIDEKSCQPLFRRLA